MVAKIVATAGHNQDLAFLSIERLAQLFRSRKLSPVEITELLLARIESANPKLNAYITVDMKGARAAARKAERELFSATNGKSGRDLGPLHGVPISLKDNIYTAGIRTTAGSEILRTFIPEYDADVVHLLKSAGAVILGKTNMHEFAYGVTCDNPHFGPVRNPWDLARISGGSSGGSAAAVAAGLCYGSVGTDTGGSIRIPAALCGVVGLKPTLHRVQERGIIPLSKTLDCAGPLARSAGDAAFLFSAMTTPAGGRQGNVAGRRKSARVLKGVRLGLPRDFFFDAIEGEVQNVFSSAVRLLRKLGAKITPISIPLLQETEDAGNQIAWAEATHFHRQSAWFPARSRDYSEDVRKRLKIGDHVSAGAYLRALETREQFIEHMSSAMEAAEVHALIVPTTPVTAPRIAEETTRVGDKQFATRALLLRLNRPANLAGVPAISIPCGITPVGLPVGLQLIGVANGEVLLLDVAHAFELACPGVRPPLEFTF